MHAAFRWDLLDISSRAPSLVLLRLNGEIIAKRIIEVACDGERDPNEVCARALRAFGFQQAPNC
jgi:hypothetical protein